MTNTETSKTAEIEKYVRGDVRFTVRNDEEFAWESASFVCVERDGDVNRGIDVDLIVPDEAPNHSTVWIHGAATTTIARDGNIEIRDADGKLITTINTSTFA
jgi:hypothetical protein